MSEKKRLLIGTDAFLPRWDGIARFLSEVIPKLKEHYDITVLAPMFPDYRDHIDVDKSIKVIRLKSFNFKFGDYHPTKFYFRKIKEEVKKADIVWTHAMMPIGTLSIFYAKKYRKPVVATVHSNEKQLVLYSLTEHNIIRKYAGFIAGHLAKRMYNKCSRIMVPSQEISDLLAWQDIKPKKIVVHLGTDAERFKPPVDKGDAKEEIGISSKEIVIGYTGRIGREKDIMTLYRAFLRVSKQNKGIKMLIVGEGVQDITNFLKAKNKVIVTGITDNIVKYLQAMDIYIMPSLTETSSLSTMEAMACGLAVVATPVGLIKDYIIEGKNGMLFPKRNAYILSKKIQALVEDKRLRQELGKNARKTIIDKYSWDKTAEKIKGCFGELLG